MAPRKVARGKPRPYDPDLPSMLCPECRGTGARPGSIGQYAISRESDPVIDLKCSTCKGKGHVNIASATA